MRIDRISENQIRCYLSKEEMDRRQLRLKELAYGTEKAKQLFHEMMQEASARFGFTADSMPVMIEAVPLHDDSLVLTVTKVDNPEELDTRFSSFAPFVKSGMADASSAAPSALSQLLETIRQDLDQEPEQNSGQNTDEAHGQSLLKKDSAPGSAGTGVSFGTGRFPDGSGKTAFGKDRLPEAPRGMSLFTFPTLGAAAEAAGMAADGFGGKSSLYRDPADSRYYLFLFHEDGAPLSEMTAALSVFSEFGTSEYITPAREQHLREHCEVICASDAVQRLAGLCDRS